MALDGRMTGVATLALATLAGCAAQGPAGPGAAPGTAPPGFQCPAAGTQMTTSDGRTLNWLGAGSDPFVCVVQTSNGQQGWLANLYPLPRPDEDTIRRGIAPLFPLAPGKAVSFVHTLYAPDGAMAYINSNWHVIGMQPMIIANTERNVLVIENLESMPAINGYSGMWTYYYDPGIRAFVGGDLRVLRGTNSAQNWRATSINAPR